MRSNFGTLLIKVLVWPWSRLPLKVHYRISPVLAFLIGKVFRYRRDTVMLNIARAFPEKDIWDIDSEGLIDKFYQHLADVFVEAVWFGGCGNRKRLHDARIVELVNPEEFTALYAKSPDVMVLCSHQGNWELSGGIESYNYTDKPFPVGWQNVRITYREMSSKAWDGFFRDNRKAPTVNRDQFEGYIESKDIVRYVLEHAGSGFVYNFITDQRPYYKNSRNLRVSFMGQECAAMSAGAALAHKTGMPVCFLSMPVESRGHYKYKYITICEDASKMSVQEIMDEYFRLLEDEIRRQPFNYLWSHRRW